MRHQEHAKGFLRFISTAITKDLTRVTLYITAESCRNINFVGPHGVHHLQPIPRVTDLDICYDAGYGTMMDLACGWSQNAIGGMNRSPAGDVGYIFDNLFQLFPGVIHVKVTLQGCCGFEERHPILLCPWDLQSAHLNLELECGNGTFIDMLMSSTTSLSELEWVQCSSGFYDTSLSAQFLHRFGPTLLVLKLPDYNICLSYITSCCPNLQRLDIVASHTCYLPSNLSASLCEVNICASDVMMYGGGFVVGYLCLDQVKILRLSLSARGNPDIFARVVNIFPNIEELSVKCHAEDAYCTDGEIVELQRMQRLKRLTIHQTNYVAGEFLTCGGFESLEHVIFRDCTQISITQITKFKENRANLLPVTIAVMPSMNPNKATMWL